MESMFDYIIICGAFLLLMYFNKKKDNHLFSPPQLYSMYWFIQIAIVVPFCGFSLWYYDGLYWILGSAVIFSGVYLLSRGNNIHPVEKDYLCEPNIFRINGLIIVSLVGIMVHIACIIYYHDISISDAIMNVSQVSRFFHDLRVKGEVKTPVISRISLIMLYAYPLLVGYYHRYIARKTFILSGGILILYAASLQGARSVFMTSCILWFSGWLVSYIEDNKIINHKLLKRFLIGILILIVISTIGLAVRVYGYQNMPILLSIQYSLALLPSYAFAHLLAFDHWFHNFSFAAFTGGQYTFFGIFNTLGWAHRVNGIFQEFFKAGILETNVYTVFRPIITDFSASGGQIFMALMAAITGISYRKILNSKRQQPFFVTVLSAFYAFLLWGFVTSIFAYASYICAFIYFYLCQKLVLWK